MSTSFYTFNPGQKGSSVNVHLNASGFDELKNLDNMTIVPTIMGSLMRIQRYESTTMQAKYRYLDLQFVDNDHIKTDAYKNLDPHVFCYILSSIPRNHTDSFMKYQLNKAAGIARAAESKGLIVDEEDMVVTAEALDVARNFFDANHDLFKECFLVMAGLADANHKGPCYAYAKETIKSLKYCYMVGVRMIEEQLISGGNLVLSLDFIGACLPEYSRYTRSMKRKYGRYWSYAAILDRESWEEYSKNPSFKLLWACAGFVGSQNGNASLLKTNIGRTTIETFMESNHAKRAAIVNVIHQSNTLVSANEYVPEDRANLLREALNNSNGADDLTVASSLYTNS